VSKIFARRPDLEFLHVSLQHVDLNAWQSEHGSVVVDELTYKRGRAPQALHLLPDYR